eukprot:scaffold57822_cov30-Tisochrysis_lutea.AAC.1
MRDVFANEEARRPVGRRGVLPVATLKRACALYSLPLHPVEVDMAITRALATRRRGRVETDTAAGTDAEEVGYLDFLEEIKRILRISS